MPGVMHYAYEQIEENKYKVCRFPYKLQRDNWIAAKSTRAKLLHSTFGNGLRFAARNVMRKMNADCVTVTYRPKKG